VSVREIVIDDPLNGDRIVEIAAVELENVISFEVDATDSASQKTVQDMTENDKRLVLHLKRLEHKINFMGGLFISCIGLAVAIFVYNKLGNEVSDGVIKTVIWALATLAYVFVGHYLN